MSDVPMASTEGNNARLVYILYLVAIILGGVTALVGLVMAYVYRGEAPEWLSSHYRFQIRTFWIGLLYSLISMLLSVIGIGFLLGFLTLIWWILRCVKGLQALEKREPVANPETWLIP